jgi:diaminopimelate epimerase
MIYKFSGAGNDFVVLDGRGKDMAPYRAVDQVRALCRQYHTDGLMILGEGCSFELPAGRSEQSEGISCDFSMEFYNPDGSGGMMCGNGGRCIVAFADMLGLKPASADGTWLFRAPDGLHKAMILQGSDSCEVSKPSLRDPSHLVVPFGNGLWAPPSYAAEGGHGYGDLTALRTWIVRLKMIDVQGIEPMKGGYFLNTGTRHFVKFVADVNAVDMEREAKPLRWDPVFQPEGTNVNFVQVVPDGLHVRTFEKGVEGETLACGTGLTASALAAYRHGILDSFGAEQPRGAGISYRLQCRRGDWLQVEFHPEPGDRFTDVYLTGPAECVAVL